MARISLKDLPLDAKISKEEMKKVTGGLSPVRSITLSNLSQVGMQQLGGRASAGWGYGYHSGSIGNF